VGQEDYGLAVGIIYQVLEHKMCFLIVSTRLVNTAAFGQALLTLSSPTAHVAHPHNQAAWVLLSHVCFSPTPI
jgi:hypothetical protein